MNRWIIAVTVMGFIWGGCVYGEEEFYTDGTLKIPMDELLNRCDGMGEDGVIHPEKIDHIIKGFYEKQCKSKLVIEKANAVIAENKAVIAKLDEKSAQLDEKSAQLDESIAKLKAETAQLDEDIAKLDKIRQLLKANGEIKK